MRVRVVKIVNTINGQESPQFAKAESPFTCLSCKNSQWTYKRPLQVPGNYLSNKLLLIKLRHPCYMWFINMVHHHHGFGETLFLQPITNILMFFSSIFAQLFLPLTRFNKKWTLPTKRQADSTSRVWFAGFKWLGEWWDYPSLMEADQPGSCLSVEWMKHHDPWPSLLSWGLACWVTSRKPIRLSSIILMTQKPLLNLAGNRGKVHQHF